MVLKFKDNFRKVKTDRLYYGEVSHVRFKESENLKDYFEGRPKNEPAFNTFFEWDAWDEKWNEIVRETNVEYLRLKRSKFDLKSFDKFYSGKELTENWRLLKNLTRAYDKSAREYNKLIASAPERKKNLIRKIIENSSC